MRHLRLTSFLLVACLLLIALEASAAVRDDWGRSLGPDHEGPQARPRPIAQASTELGADERATIAVFERAARSVVFIANTALRQDFWSLNLFEVPQGSGSGFVWNREGHIVTNFHVVYGADTITVIMADRTEYRAKVVGIDPDHDLAVLQIRALADALVPAAVGSSHDLRVGQKVLAIGNWTRR